MLCIKCNNVVFLFARAKGDYVLACNECNHEESVVCPGDELGTFYFDQFIILAYGEDFYCEP